jgi:hypothetical protein
VVVQHGEEEKDGALEFGEGGDPSDWLRVHGMKGKPEGGPESESGSAEGGDQKIDKRYDDGVQEDVDEVPAERTIAKEGVFRGITEKLQRTIVVAANTAAFVGIASEVPDFSGKDPAEIFAFNNDGILEDLELVVGNEVVAEGGGVEGEGEEDEEGEMEEAGAA